MMNTFFGAFDSFTCLTPATFHLAVFLDVNGSAESRNMVFTQGPLSLGESLGHERRNTPMTFFSDGDSGTPSLFVQAANLWYNSRDTYIVRFVADGCRKNLPLGDMSQFYGHGL